MPQPLDIVCEVNKGRISKEKSRWVRDHLRLFEGREVRIQITAPKRSTRANRFYWAAINAPIRQAMIEAGIGFVETPDGIMPVSADAVHQLFKRRYLDARTEVIFGEDVTLEPSTTELDSTAFHDFIEAIKYDEDVVRLGVHFEEPPDGMRSHKIAEAA